MKKFIFTGTFEALNREEAELKFRNLLLLNCYSLQKSHFDIKNRPITAFGFLLGFEQDYYEISGNIVF